MGCEQHRGDYVFHHAKMTPKVSDLGCWKDGVTTIYRNRKDCQKRKFGGNEEYVLDELYLLFIAT